MRESDKLVLLNIYLFDFILVLSVCICMTGVN